MKSYSFPVSNLKEARQQDFRALGFTTTDLQEAVFFNHYGRTICTRQADPSTGLFRYDEGLLIEIKKVTAGFVKYNAYRKTEVPLMLPTKVYVLQALDRVEYFEKEKSPC